MSDEKQPESEFHSMASNEVSSEETRCRNCGTVLTGKYCSHCGQKAEKLHIPFFHVIGEFIGDFFHFDSKFSKTFVPLLFKPGFLTKEYIQGRRARYVNPIRLYFFISVVFFIFYLGIFSQEFISPAIQQGDRNASFGLIELDQDTSVQVVSQPNANIFSSEGKSDSTAEYDIDNYIQQLPASVKAYEDSVLKLSDDQRPGLIQQAFTKQMIKARQEGETFGKHLAEIANHNLPKLMFFLLPVFALLLKLLYTRRKIYFVDHAVFSLHFHAFAFILFFVALIVAVVFPKFGAQPYVVLILLVYLFIALKNIYQQSWKKTLAKLFLLSVSYGLWVGIALLLSFIYAALTA